MHNAMHNAMYNAMYSARYNTICKKRKALAKINSTKFKQGNIFNLQFGKNPEGFPKSDYDELFSYPMILLMSMVGYLFKDLVTICPGWMDQVRRC
jgi:hypothetical protein